MSAERRRAQARAQYEFARVRQDARDRNAAYGLDAGEYWRQVASMLPGGIPEAAPEEPGDGETTEAE